MKKTPLHQWHIDNGANMAEFGNYSMPLWYPGGVRKEHLSVIEAAGLFDTSHMAVVLLKGSAARSLLQRAFTKDLDRCIGADGGPLVAGRCIYGVFLHENGHVLDDAIVYQVRDNLFVVVVNAGMGQAVAAHLREVAGSVDIDIMDLTDTLGKIDIQGPASAAVLSHLLKDPDGVFAKMSYFSFKGWFEAGEKISSVQLLDGTPILLSRTGYTGEFGFELFLPAGQLEDVWLELLEQGRQYNIMASGLAARDSLRAGAVLPLSHQDVGDWPFAANPWEFALAFGRDGSFTKEFIGSTALQHLENSPITYAFAGYDPRKIPPGGNTAVLDQDEKRIGDILTCATDMAIGRVAGPIISLATSESDGRPKDFVAKGLCCGFVRVQQKLQYGDKVFLTDGKRKIEVEIRKDIRPDRTARCSLQNMRQYQVR